MDGLLTPVVSSVNAPEVTPTTDSLKVTVKVRRRREAARAAATSAVEPTPPDR